MCIVTVCLGLRVSETLGLKWGDFDWDDLRVKIQRSWVAGVEDEVKTLYSKKWMPVDPILAELLLELKGRTATLAKDTDWVFVNPETGKPYWPGRLQEHHLVPAGKAAKIRRIGWHTFRHTYSTLLRAFGVDVKVQQELLRHADNQPGRCDFHQIAVVDHIGSLVLRYSTSLSERYKASVRTLLASCPS